MISTIASSLNSGMNSLASSFFTTFPNLANFLAQEGTEKAQEAVEQAGGIGLKHYLVVSGLVFTMGIMVIVMRRNAIAVLMGIELLLNSASLNFVACSKFLANPIEGQVITVFLIVLAAAEAALALAIILNIFNNTNSIEVAEADSLKG